MKTRWPSSRLGDTPLAVIPNLAERRVTAAMKSLRALGA